MAFDGQRQLCDAFAAGTLIRPNSGHHSFVDLVHAVAALTGVPIERNHRAEDVSRQIGAHEHYVFVLVDAMGASALSLLPEESFLRTHHARELQAVFPASTVCALTTLATGLWPAQHGAVGWWEYLDEFALTATTLPFVERFTGEPLSHFGVLCRDIWPWPSLAKQMSHEPLFIHPCAFWDSNFTRYFRGERGGAGYDTIPHAFDQVVARLQYATDPTYTYVYLPEFDVACHLHGTTSREACDVLTKIDHELGRMTERLAGKARLIVTADHGQVDVDEAHRLAFVDGDPLLQMLRVPPTGGSRVALYHLKDGVGEKFADAFNARYGETFALLRCDEVEAMEILGPAPLTSFTRRRTGDYMSIPLNNTALRYYGPGKNVAADDIGRHCGMSPEEMCIPLILA